MHSPTEPTTSPDLLGRPHRKLRISVTDRCNLRCGYCMPEEEYTWLQKSKILSFEEISSLVDAFAAQGVDGIRLTGGEPLLRRDMHRLVAMIAAKPAIKDLAMTTNAIQLPTQAKALRAAGLDRLTISLDTLQRERFHELTRRDDLERALAGIEAASQAGFRGTKVNTVVLRGTNDDELVELLKFGSEQGLEIRFIEYMDVGGATRWRIEDVVSRDEILGVLERHFGPIKPLVDPSNLAAPAQRYALPDGTRFGIIASTTQPFCARCDRSRLTADGMWYTCLYAQNGMDLSGPLRAGVDGDRMRALIGERWGQRDDRGAEERLSRDRIAFSADTTRKDPHFEMHTRGG
jgi:cyclic pyranopterin phosphate synthase